MASDSPDTALLDRARGLEPTFRVKPGLYLLGSLERGVTVYSQQVRAHNLVWALWELSQSDGIEIKNVAVIGGGIGGLTATACLLARFGPAIHVTLFEKRRDLCPLQQGSDSRWLHPRIYDWPNLGSKAPDAKLPVLNWVEGRASDVARTVLQTFGGYCRRYSSPDTLSFYVGLRHFQITAALNEISWVGDKASIDGSFLVLHNSEGMIKRFDTIILAVGFGLEIQPPEFPLNSYWRNEIYGRPILNGTQQPYMVSGFGDGALVDLFRLTIERFRQDTVLPEIFPNYLEQLEEFLNDQWTNPEDNAFGFFTTIEADKLANGIRELSKRLRKDTRVLLHLSGRRGEIKTFPAVFGRASSFLNRLLLFMLYRCGAFHISFGPLEKAAKDHGAAGLNVLCRHGADVMQHLREIIADFDLIKDRLLAMKENQAQAPSEFWPPGFFPPFANGERNA